MLLIVLLRNTGASESRENVRLLARTDLDSLGTGEDEETLHATSSAARLARLTRLSRLAAAAGLARLTRAGLAASGLARARLTRAGLAASTRLAAAAGAFLMGS